MLSLLKSGSKQFRAASGFTLIEVIVAASLMVILAVGVLSVFSYATKLNAGNALRAQAQTVLQKEVERYRAMKFVPSNPPRDAALNATASTGVTFTCDGTARCTSQDGTQFNIKVTITNLPSPAGAATTDDSAPLQQIVLEATPKIARQGWLANLRTSVTLIRVRSN
jgi:prepilin-type N-terminal cleavage/methylation domain-containing protein